VAAIWLIIGVALGAGATALVMRERIRAVRASQEQMSDSFKALSAEALQASVGHLTELARAQQSASQAEARGDLDKRAQAVAQLVEPLREQLGRVDQQLLALNRERHESRGRLENQLKTLTETQERLRTETGALVTALRKPNIRGQWGQMQLRKVVELAGMVRHCDFTEQATFSDGEDGSLRPDMVVKLPGGKHVVVDAKAPLQGILDAYEAADEDARVAHLRDHAPGCSASTSSNCRTSPTGRASRVPLTSSSCSSRASTCTARRSRPTLS
jgi:DNA recombination protein RmuC